MYLNEPTISISLATKCTTGNSTLLGPCPTMTNTPPGLVACRGSIGVKLNKRTKRQQYHFQWKNAYAFICVRVYFSPNMNIAMAYLPLDSSYYSNICAKIKVTLTAKFDRNVTPIPQRVSMPLDPPPANWHSVYQKQFPKYTFAQPTTPRKCYSPTSVGH